VAITIQPLGGGIVKRQHEQDIDRLLETLQTLINQARQIEDDPIAESLIGTVLLWLNATRKGLIAEYIEEMKEVADHMDKHYAKIYIDHETGKVELVS
jgi:hypothetical protein